MKILILNLLLLSSSSHAAPIQYQAGQGQVQVMAIGKPSFIKIKGEGSSPQGQIELEDKTAKATFEFDLKSLDTGIELRNEHMKDKYLEVGKHPKAKLVIPVLTLPKPWTPGQTEVKEQNFSGDLTLHGVTKPVSGVFSVSADGVVQAKFQVKLSNFSIQIPSYMGITVADSVDVSVKLNELKTVK
ncbi:MAG: YceI family protein [Bdellovibrionales bacterium]